MNINFYLCFSIILATDIAALICRTPEHMKKQQDFYKLISNCMMSTTNATHMNPTSADYHRQRHQQNLRNRLNFNNQRQDNRYDQNRNNVRTNDNGELSKNSNNCNTQTQGYHNYQNNNYREEFHVPRYRKKREMMLVQKYVKKNSTNPAMKKSLLEDIGACVIHCIFQEMKMLNSDSKLDRQTMITVMTSRIRDLELKEFIQDSIEECFDITDSDSHEEQCDFSKKVILCLEEKAKRGCEDWEIENSTHISDSNFNDQTKEMRGNYRQKNK